MYPFIQVDLNDINMQGAHVSRKTQLPVQYYRVCGAATVKFSLYEHNTVGLGLVDCLRMWTFWD